MSEEEVEQCLIEWLAAEAGELEETAYKRNEQFSSQ